MAHPTHDAHRHVNGPVYMKSVHDYQVNMALEAT
jgi:hypothetical protein